MTIRPGFRFAAFVLASASVLATSFSCKRPAEPVLPADLSGRWVGGYTLFDSSGRSLTDSLQVSLSSDRGEVNGDGVRRRFLDQMPPQESRIVVSGTVAATSFHLRFNDPESGHGATFSGTLEDDTLRGDLRVSGSVVGSLAMSQSAGNGGHR